MRNRYGRDVYVRRGLAASTVLMNFPRASRPKLSMVGRMLHEALKQGEIKIERPDEQAEWTYAPDIGRALGALVEAESLNHALYQLASGERLSRLHIARQIQQRLSMGSAFASSTDTEATEPPITRLGWLDTSRLEQDTGFCMIGPS